jgi:hypothetical protein
LIQIALLGLLGVLVGYAIPVLIQVRRTARVMEDLVRDSSPRLLGATANLDSVLGRTDRVMQGMEYGARGITGAVSGVQSFLGNFRMPASGVKRGPATMAALANFLSGVWQAWVAFSPDPSQAKAAGAAPPESPASDGEKTNV